MALALLGVGGSSAAGGTDASFKVLELTSSGAPLTVFETAEQLVSADTDGAVDVYMRVGAGAGNTSLLSDRAQAGPDTDTPATFNPSVGATSVKCFPSPSLRYTLLGVPSINPT